MNEIDRIKAITQAINLDIEGDGAGKKWLADTFTFDQLGEIYIDHIGHFGTLTYIHEAILIKGTNNDTNRTN